MHHVLPSNFTERLREIVGPAELERCLASFATPRPVAFRVNTLRATVSEVRAELATANLYPEPVPWYRSAFLLPPSERDRVSHSAAFEQGRIYIQNLSSMLAPILLAPQPGHMVLDLASAPGGKTLQMAAMMGNEGSISAVEPIRHRYYKLRENLRIHGATIVRTYRTDGRSAGRKTPERFDRVLLDAPCSCEARFRADRPRSWAHWSERKIREQARKQKGLLQSALLALKPGGTLVYCTCSFAPEENEMVINQHLQRMSGYVEIVQIELPVDNVRPGLTQWRGRSLHNDLRLAWRVLPTETMEGCFLCKLQKIQSVPRWRAAK